MATGIVVGLSRHREGWSPLSRDSDQKHYLTRPVESPFPAMSSAGHHRSHSDKPDTINRPRLPPLRNVLEGAGRPDLTYQPPFSVPSGKSAFPNSPSQGRPSASPSSLTWSPSSESKASYKGSPPHQSRARPAGESHFPAPEYGRRATVTLPPMSNSDGRTYSAYPVTTSADPNNLSPHAKPRKVLREEVIPGKGLCYVYDDGSYCQKVINGDPVNPNWGTTKAGKPRKRLGQACNTCREKKIKCDPGNPKCSQCHKFGRECRFEAPSRMPHRSPKMRPQMSPTTPTSPDDVMRTRRPSVALTETSSHSDSGTTYSRYTTIADDHLPPISNESALLADAPGPNKKARLTHGQADALFDDGVRTSSVDPINSFALDVDPFKISRKTTETYLDAYLNNVNSSTFSLVPASAFVKWVENESDKSLASKLVLYCMLALGTVFAKSPERTIHEQQFASIALEGIRQSFGQFSLQLIQARLIFALYEFHNGRDERAWDLCGAAIRSAVAMRLNSEEGISQQLCGARPVYGLDQAMLAECMRRTFWSAFVMERFGVACLGFTTTLDTADCFVRLPCTRQAYESGTIPLTPTFDSEVQLVRPGKDGKRLTIGILAFMVQIASLCCDAQMLASRAKHHHSSNPEKHFAAKRSELESQLSTWAANYTTHIADRSSAKSILHSSPGFGFGGLHIMYHYACMQLHRHVHHSRLNRSQVAEHAKKAYYHAEKTLEIAGQLTNRNYQEIRHYDFAASSPLSGYAILAAVDVLTAAGINTKLLQDQSALLGLLLGSAQLLDSLTEVWASARMQQRLVSDRIHLVMNLTKAGIAEGKAAFYVPESIAMSLGKEGDLVYGIDRVQYLEALGFGDQVHDRFDLIEATNKTKRGYSTWKD